MSTEQAAKEFSSDLVIEIGIRKNIDLETNEYRGDYLIARLRYFDEIMKPSLGTTIGDDIDASAGALCLTLLAMRRAALEGRQLKVPAEIFLLP